MTDDAVGHWLSGLPPESRDRATPVVEAIRRSAPDLPVVIQGDLLAFGPFRYRYDSGRAGETAKLSLAIRAHGISVYVNCLEGAGYLLEKHLPFLGRASAGKSCLRFRKFSDLDPEGFANLVRAAAVSTGAGSVN